MKSCCQGLTTTSLDVQLDREKVFLCGRETVWFVWFGLPKKPQVSDEIVQ